MNISQFRKKLLRKNGKAAMVSFAQASDFPTASKQELDLNIQLLISYLFANQRREAFATALSLVMANADGSIARLRRTGALRASRYNFVVGGVADIVKVILDTSSMTKLSSKWINYLESVRALHRLAPEVGRMRGEILSLLKAKKQSSLKTLIMLANESFVKERQDTLENKSPLDSYYITEEFIEGISMLINIIRKEIKIPSDCFRDIDEKSLLQNDIYDNILFNATHITKFREAETLIDGLPYNANLDGFVVTVSSIDPTIEKSIRLGYIQTQFQRWIRLQQLINLGKCGKGPISLGEVVKRAFDAGLGEMVKVYEKPVRRLVFEMPTEPKFLKFLFGGDVLFEEEWSSLLHLNVEDYEKNTDEKSMINDKVSVLDVFKVQRLFRFVSYVYDMKLSKIADKKERLMMNIRSAIPVFEHKQLLMLIQIVLPQTHAEEVLRLLTLDDSRSHVDLQYTPFLKIGDQYMIAPRLVAESNLVRNLACANNIRPKFLGGKDPMQQAVVNALRKANFKVRSEFKSKIDGKILETDIFAWRDGTLFIFECKNAYFPCTVHEMRNSYDLIETAGKQLDIRVAFLRETINQVSLFKALGWDIDPTNEVYSGIIIANRVFHGAKQNNHPVRQAHELINVLLHGTIQIEGNNILFWHEPEFHANDLVTYLSDKSIVSDQLFELQPFTYKIPFGHRSLAFKSYHMDIKACTDKLKALYPAKN
jgi:hypothetical protein